MARSSVKALAAKATRDDAKARASRYTGDGLGASTVDSFVNFAHKLGIGADNPLSNGSYGFNPVTRNRTLLEWIYRGSWLGGVAVDLIADDMTRQGIDFVTELPPDDAEKLDRFTTAADFWALASDVVRWGRLYGGAIGIALVDGQDMRTPLRVETVGPNQYVGILVLDRWQVEPSLEDLVTEFGPRLGSPKFYRIQSNAPALRGCAVHHSRVLFRNEGISLPYNQKLTENLWGISVLERLYDRMVAFDSATTGAAQLVYKSYLRTLKVEGLREVVAAGGKALDGLTQYVQMMARFQSIEGVTMIDVKDELTVDSHAAFSGLSDALVQFGQQISGALQIPLVRLFGQSPAGLNATGESDLRTYYDHVKQRQVREMKHGVTLHYKLAAATTGITLPPNFEVDFTSLWDLTDTDKANIAKTDADTVMAAADAGLISQQTALKELRQSSRSTGRFTNITEADIALADISIGPPPTELAMMQMEADAQAKAGAPGEDNGNGDTEVRQDGPPGAVAGSAARRKFIQQPTQSGGATGGQPSARPSASRDRRRLR